MPVTEWTGVSDTLEAAKIVGARLKKIRENRGLTIRDLAERAQISKNTVLRIEQGLPISEANLTRLCDCLQTILPNLLIPERKDDSKVRVHRYAEDQWRIAFRRKSAPKTIQDFDVVENPEERKRLSGLRYVSGFAINHECLLEGGNIQSALMEVHGDQEIPGFRHSGEEFVYCLQGRLRLTVGKEQFILNPGDGASFWSRYRHRYESEMPADSPTPTRILMVWFEATEEPQARAHDEECETD